MSLNRYAKKRDSVERESAPVKKRAAYGSLVGNFVCLACGKNARGRITEGRGKYCSAACHNAHRDRRGEANPNFRNSGHRVCTQCGEEFHSYDKKRKYCSFACYNATRPATIKPVRVRRSVALTPCLHCGNACLKSQKYCSRSCREASLRPPQTSACLKCGTLVRYSPSRPRKYCSYPCFVADDGAIRAGQAAAENIMKKYGAKKDANHKELMDVISQFAAVHDLSHAGYGVPDGIAYVNDSWQLFDIKNPKTTYGRRGLNERQKRWVADWRGGPVYLIHDVDEAQRFAKGNFDGLKCHEPGGSAS